MGRILYTEKFYIFCFCDLLRLMSRTAHRWFFFQINFFFFSIFRWTFIWILYIIYLINFVLFVSKAFDVLKIIRYQLGCELYTVVVQHKFKNMQGFLPFHQ